MATSGVSLPHAGVSGTLPARSALRAADHEEQATIRAAISHEGVQLRPSTALALHDNRGEQTSSRIENIFPS